MQATELEATHLLDSLNTALVMIDGNLIIKYANHAGQALFETGTKQLYGHPLSDFLMPHSLDKSRLRAAFRRGEDFTENEVRLAFKDNRYVLADLTVTNLNTEQGRLLLFEVKKIDQQNRISRENLQNAQHYAARELIRGLAHEIKNPLGGIRGAAQLLEKELPTEGQREFTQMIIEQSDRLRNLVDRLLGPNSLPRLQWSNLHQALEKVRTLMKVDSETPVTIIRDYDPSIPDIHIDQDMIQQAVLNIVRNSMQALAEHRTPDPQIRLVTRIERQMTMHGKRHPLVAKLTIIDNGPGIPQSIRDTLFYPMVSSKRNGSGLGLSIAQTLINHHGGKIDVDSRPGHTEFVLYLPIDRKESAI
ncbi:nitrogen regulation protein NR(II) [Alteromonas aestuariivivens]|uniref:Sensory histidine kinase/phosphatase NtrB n=1 Tax=Alteromonas aestuariivivens TaxID=1938339 RepID=A0A3D8MFI6_9ALTE|nr:nitrogen regulation protein NR(II) [Alteromonas aestuariivivens]RDV28958.1 nitrogen regulation protein NR(II) [Alteromonas aestuariivivens]